MISENIPIIHGRIISFWNESRDLSRNRNLTNLNRIREELLSAPEIFVMIASNDDKSQYMMAVIKDAKNFVYAVDSLGVFQVVAKRKVKIKKFRNVEYYSAKSSDLKVYTNNVNIYNLNSLLDAS